MERKMITIVSENDSQNASQLSIPKVKHKEPSNELFLMKQLKNQEYVHNRNAAVALFRKALAIPKLQKYKLIREINQNSVIRQVDTPESRLKKIRKSLDIKKVVEVKRRDSRVQDKLYIKRDHLSSEDQQLVFNAHTRLQQNYDQIKRILHDQDNYLYDLYYDHAKLEVEEDGGASTTTSKSTKIAAPDINKATTDVMAAKKVVVEETASDISLTNDLYDYTKSPQTERHLLDLALRRANWAERRRFHLRQFPSAYNQRGSTATSYNMGVPLGFTSTSLALKEESSRRSIIDKRKSALQIPHFESRKKPTLGIPIRESLMPDEEKNKFFPELSEDMKGISIVSRKTIQYMNSKNGEKKNSQLLAKKGMDTYIWYLIDPIAKMKYDTFLQKTTTIAFKSDNNNEVEPLSQVANNNN